MRRRAREIPTVSYANPDDPLLRRLAIHSIEKVTGQPRLARLYREYRLQGGPEASFWEAAVRRLRLSVRYDETRFRAIPKEGPLVVVANHPYGVLDGIVISYLTSKVRREFKVLAHSVLYRAPEIRPFLLPIDFTETKQAVRQNLESRRLALEQLAEGGAVIVFPAGAVSTAERWFSRAVDSEWKPFTAKLIAQSQATVLPIFFEGQNSRLFQIASHINGALREALILKEVARRIGSEVRLQIGDPIPYGQIDHIKDRQSLVDYLRAITYGLNPAGETVGDDGFSVALS
ncbi:MAG: lysophospholipid acyltransferase family protein [Kiloniellales bacterium]|nr:lysophospholipid acyltransferase family protein [Kiloniellales bacterium]